MYDESCRAYIVIHDNTCDIAIDSERLVGWEAERLRGYYVT